VARQPDVQVLDPVPDGTAEPQMRRAAPTPSLVAQVAGAHADVRRRAPFIENGGLDVVRDCACWNAMMRHTTIVSEHHAAAYCTIRRKTGGD
jgi:hypothetical protein